ncbi:MAG: flagellar basal body-associated FliL family protein [Rhodoferax sp.]
MSDKPVEAEAEAKPKSPLIKIIIGVVVLLVLVAGTVVGTLFLTGFFNKPVPTADEMISEDSAGHGAPAADAHGAPAADAHGAKPAADAHGAKPAADAHGAKPAADAHGAKKSDSKDPKLSKKSPDVPRFNYTYHQMERDFLINLTNSKKVMSVQIAVVTRYDQRVIDNVKKHEFALRAVIMDVMRLTTEADLVKPDFRTDIAAKVRNAMNNLLEKYEDFGGIEDVYFTAFIVQ